MNRVQSAIDRVSVLLWRVIRRAVPLDMVMIGNSWANDAGALKPGQGFGSRIADGLGVRHFSRRGHNAAQAHYATNGGFGDGGHVSQLQMLHSSISAGSKSAPLTPGVAKNGHAPRHTIVGSCYAQNDAAQLGANTRPFEESMRVIYGRAVASRIYENTDANWTYTGTWTDSTYAPFQQQITSGNSSKYTSTVGDSATLTLDADMPGGRVVDLDLIVHPTTDIEVTIARGATTLKVLQVKGSEICDQNANALAKTFNQAHTLIRLGRHLDPYVLTGGDPIKITLTGRTAGRMEIDYGQEEADPADGPLLWELLPPNLPAEGYAYYVTNGYAQAAAMNDAMMALYRTRLAAVLAEFDGKVRRTVAIDVSDIPTADLFDPATDPIHPKPDGHKLIANRGLSTLLRSGLITWRLCTSAIASRRRFFYALGGLGAWGVQSLVAATYLNGWSNYSPLQSQFVDLYPGYSNDRQRLFFRGRIKPGESGKAAFIIHPFNLAAGGTFPVVAGIDDQWTTTPITATGGWFRWSWDGGATYSAQINANDSLATITSKIAAISGWSYQGVNNVTVTGSLGAGLTVTAVQAKGGQAFNVVLDTSGLTGGGLGQPNHAQTGQIVPAAIRVSGGGGASEFIPIYNGTVSWVDLSGLEIETDI